MSPKQRREIRQLDNMIALRRLAAKFSVAEPGVVKYVATGMFGARHLLCFADGTLLRLKLFWVNKAEMVAVTNVWWNDRVGWMVRGLDATGEIITLATWSAQVRVAAPQSPLPTRSHMI